MVSKRKGNLQRKEGRGVGERPPPCSPGGCRSPRVCLQGGAGMRGGLGPRPSDRRCVLPPHPAHAHMQAHTRAHTHTCTHEHTHTHTDADFTAGARLQPPPRCYFPGGFPPRAVGRGESALPGLTPRFPPPWLLEQPVSWVHGGRSGIYVCKHGL